MTSEEKLKPGFYERTLPYFGTDADRDAVRGNAEALHAAIRNQDMPAIRRHVVPWHMHIDRSGRHHDFRAWLAYLQRQPRHRRDTMPVIGAITINDGMALLAGYSRLPSGGLPGDVTAVDDISRFTQVWVHVNDVWRRVVSRSSPREATQVSTP